MSDSVLHVRWTAWDESTSEEFTLRWEGGGWVGEGIIVGVDVHYVMRFGPNLDLRQFLLFRDDEEPDLWLATDGAGRWGEVNGAERHDLADCTTISLTCSPSSALMAVRSLGLAIGERAVVHAVTVDVETLEVVPALHLYTRLAESRWSLTVESFGLTTVFDVDDDGVLLHAPGWFRRTVADV